MSPLIRTNDRLGGTPALDAPLLEAHHVTQEPVQGAVGSGGTTPTNRGRWIRLNRAGFLTTGMSLLCNRLPSFAAVANQMQLHPQGTIVRESSAIGCREYWRKLYLTIAHRRTA